MFVPVHWCYGTAEDASECLPRPVPGQTKMARHRRGDIGIGRSRPDRAGRRSAIRKHRRLLARVVGAAKRRIAAVIRGDDHEVICAQDGIKLGQAAIERFERGGVAGDVAAMAVERIEVNKVGE